MNIAIITSVLGQAGGMGRVVEEHAVRLAKRGHAVTIFVPSGKHDAVPGVTMVEIKPRFRYGHGSWITDFAKYLDGFEVVHFHYPFLGGVGAILRWRRKNSNAKLVVTYHMDLVGRGVFRPVFRLYQSLIMPRLLKIADRIMVSSLDYAAAGDLKNFLPGLKNKIVELPFGIDLERFAPRPVNDELLKQLQITPDESVVLFVGGLDSAHYFKGVDFLLKAFSGVLAELQNVRLVIVGRGNRLDYFKKFAKKLKIDSKVVFASAVAGEQLAAYYNLADVLVLPSIDRSEAFGLVLLEAQASGVPVICTDIPGVRTVVVNQETGLLVPPRNSQALAQSISRLLTNPDELLRMAGAARVRAETNYRWDAIIENLERIYQSVI